MCGIREKNLEIQKSLLNFERRKSESRKTVREAIVQFEHFNKCDNTRKITTDILPAMVKTFLLIKEAVALVTKVPKLSSSDLQLRERFSKVEKNFLKRQKEIQNAYLRRKEETKGELYGFTMRTFPKLPVKMPTKGKLQPVRGT